MDFLIIVVTLFDDLSLNTNRLYLELFESVSVQFIGVIVFVMIVMIFTVYCI